MAERYSVAIRDMPVEERPRERAMRHGVQVLSLSELLAIQLRVGAAGRSAIGLADLLASEMGGLRGIGDASVERMSQLPGIGEAKAIQILAAIEIGKRYNALNPESRTVIRNPLDVANLLMPDLRFQQKEHLVALHLDTKNRVIKSVTVSVGTLDSSLVHPREVFREAIASSSAALIVAHNHPSGDPAPSAEDVRVTERLVEAGKIIGIDLLDHIVLGDGCWVSLKEKGRM